MPGDLSNSGNGTQVKYFLGGILLGAAVGSALALLYAPMKGEDTRRLIKNKAVEAEQMAAEKANQVKNRAGEMAADAREKVSAVTKRGEEILDCLKEQKA